MWTCLVVSLVTTHDLAPDTTKLLDFIEGDRQALLEKRAMLPLLLEVLEHNRDNDVQEEERRQDNEGQEEDDSSRYRATGVVRGVRAAEGWTHHAVTHDAVPGFTSRHAEQGHDGNGEGLEVAVLVQVGAVLDAAEQEHAYENQNKSVQDDGTRK